MQGRFDDVVGTGFVLISRSHRALSSMGETAAAALRQLNARTAVIVPAGADAGQQGWEDLDGKFLPFMERHGIETMLVRPDFHIYGAVGSGENPQALLVDCEADLRRSGLRNAKA